MAFLLPATVVSITAVLLVISAAVVVLSILLPFASFSSIPSSSTKAPRVPEPSSRDTTVMLPVTPAVAFLFPLSLFPAEQPANTLPTSAPATARLSRTFAVLWVLFCFVMIHSPFSHLV